MTSHPETQYSFFGDHLALAALSQAGDRLEELDRRIDFAPLVAVADAIWRKNASAKDARGRKPWPSELMLRVLLLKRLYNLSDEQLEFQLRDRLSFLRFARLGLGSPVPDSRTLWLYGEMLAQADGARQLFDAFNAQLQAQGLMLQEGVMVDATIVEVPRQRNSREDNARIKQGETPPAWKEQPRKLAQKDVTARWTKKNHATFYGYKDHLKITEQTKLIADYRVTPANVPDGVLLPELVGEAERGRRLHADSGYAGRPIAAHLAAHGVINCVHEKGEAQRPLSDEQKQSNRTKSRIRARVEHPFAFMEQSLGGLYQRCIGLVRHTHQLGLAHLLYNLCRFVQWQRAATATVCS
jgi:IS5 family transposase